jgi:hypothetical protein
MRLPSRCLTGLAFCALLGAQGCVTASVASRWRQEPLEFDATDQAWSGVDANPGDPRLRAMNDGGHLYLELSTTSEPLKAELLGAFHQGLNVWFDPTGKHLRQRGLRLSFVPKPGSVFPLDPTKQWDFLNGCSQTASLLGPEGSSPLPLSPSASLAWEAHLNGDQLSLQLRLDLGDERLSPLAVGRKPGQPLSLGLETTALNRAQAREMLAEANDPRPNLDAPPDAKAETPLSKAPMSPMGGGGMGGGRHHHGGGGEGGERSGRGPGHGDSPHTLTEVPDPLLMWAVIQLAPPQR